MLRNFTVFRSVALDFVPGLNVLVGGNATGKTHVLKVLYAAQVALDEASPLGQALLSVFIPEHIGDLVARGASAAEATIDITLGGSHHVVKVNQTEVEADTNSPRAQRELRSRPVYIPPGDILGHSVGFRSLFDAREVDFERFYDDLLSSAQLPPLRKPDTAGILRIIEDKLGGRAVSERQRFYIVAADGARLEIHMAAEGWRKLALLYLLIANGSIGPGTVLYWDEPETNISPSNMDELVKLLIELSRRGTQIFLATHSYIILKELDLQRQPWDSIRHFAMERKKTGAVVHPADTYAEIHPNLIAEQFERLYNLEIDRSLGQRP